MTNKEITEHQEEQMVHLVRNALLVAGHEMGDGDHIPVVNATIHSIMKDWENLKIERRVHEELKKHLGEQLTIMETELPKCSPEAREALAPKIKEFREVYEAYFEDLNTQAVYEDSDCTPDHIKRMNTILETLEGENEQ